MSLDSITTELAAIRSELKSLTKLVRKIKSKQEDPNGESIDLTEGNIEQQVERIVSTMMVDVLSKYTDRFEKFSQVTQVDFGRETLRFKDVLTKKIAAWFESRHKEFEQTEMLTKSNIVLKSADIEGIVQDVFAEMSGET